MLHEVLGFVHLVDSWSDLSCSNPVIHYNTFFKIYQRHTCNVKLIFTLQSNHNQFARNLTMKVANLVICIWLSITCSLLLVVYNYGLREKWDKFWYKFKPLISFKIFPSFSWFFQIWPTLISICYLRVKELSCKYVRKWKIEVKWSEVNIKPWCVTQASKKLNRS